MPARELLNGCLDKLVRPEFRLLGRPRPAFQVCGLTGFVLAAALAGILAQHLGLSLLLMAALTLAAVLAFFGLVLAGKVATGEELIVCYHHEAAVLIAATLLPWLTGRPVLPYLDVTALCFGAFLICGRAGCLMVGCCHGRPHRWGVCYREEHAAAGFASYYVGVRLLPVQAVESLWVLCVVAAGVGLVVGGRPPGTVLAWYAITYGAGRFCFEFMRGDPGRPYYRGFSQPQWTSLLLMCGVVGAETAGVLPFHAWHVAATAALALAAVAVSLVRRCRRTPRHRLLHPRHIKEVAEALGVMPEPRDEKAEPRGWTVLPRQDPTVVQMGCTSLGVRISAGRVRSGSGFINHYALSSRDDGMTEEAARVLAELILRLKQTHGPGEFVKGNRNVFHLLTYPVAGKELTHR